MIIAIRKRRFIHTRKRAKRAFNLFMMRARRPRSILQTNSALNTQHSTLHTQGVDKTTLSLFCVYSFAECFHDIIYLFFRKPRIHGKRQYAPSELFRVYK